MIEMTLYELAEAIKSRGIEIDIRGISDEDINVLEKFISTFGLNCQKYYRKDAYLILSEWSEQYGILVGNSDGTLGANSPGRVCAEHRISFRDAIKIINQSVVQVSDQDFEDVFK